MPWASTFLQDMLSLRPRYRKGRIFKLAKDTNPCSGTLQLSQDPAGPQEVVSSSPHRAFEASLGVLFPCLVLQTSQGLPQVLGASPPLGPPDQLLTLPYFLPTSADTCLGPIWDHVQGGICTMGTRYPQHSILPWVPIYATQLQGGRLWSEGNMGVHSQSRILGTSREARTAFSRPAGGPTFSDKTTTAFPVLSKVWMTGQGAAALQLGQLWPTLSSPCLTSTWPQGSHCPPSQQSVVSIVFHSLPILTVHSTATPAWLSTATPAWLGQSEVTSGLLPT